MTGEWPIKVVRLEPPAPPVDRSAWLLSPAVFLFAAGATFLLFYLRTGSAQATTSRTGPLLDPRAASIQLRVDTQSSGLMLSWNRYSPAVEAASLGVLHIDDGSDHRDLTLDRNQILNGSVFYRPMSQDVSFRLDLRDGRGSDVAQILRVLDAQPRGGLSGDAQPRGGLSSDAQPRGAVKPVALVPDVAKKPEPAPSRFVQSSSSREATVTTKKPLQPEPEQTRPIAHTAEAAPVASNIATPLPEPPVISQPLSSATPEPALSQPAPSQPSPSPKAQPPAPTAGNPAAPLVPSGPAPNYVPPKPLRWMKVDEESLGIPKVAQGTDVKVKIKIDEAGNVTSAHALIDGPKRDKKLMAAAAAAVRQWKFDPAKAHGANVASEETIVLHFGPEAQ